MTSDEYNERMKALVENLPKLHADLMVGIANGALAMVKNRILSSGVDSKGGKYRSYSAWYQKYKTEKGKYKGFTDFSFTNRMWTNIQLIKERTNENIAVITALDKGQSGTTIKVPVKAHTRKGKPIKASEKSLYVPSNYEKLEKNTNSFGEILALTEQEINDLRSDYDQGILDIFRANGL